MNTREIGDLLDKLTDEERLTKEEYIALELTRCWASGLPNRHSLYMKDILRCYDMALEHLEGKTDENS